MNLLNQTLAEIYSDIAAALDAERRRQETTLEMIASENFAPLAVMQAQGSVATNKYAEGYPGRRYYGGCEHIDVIETLAIERLKTLFGADYAQAHSGAQANMAVSSPYCNPATRSSGSTSPTVAISAAACGSRTRVRPSTSWRITSAPTGLVDMGGGRSPRPRALTEDDHRRLVGLPPASRLPPLPPGSPTRSALT